jgi:hypothetical protein
MPARVVVTAVEWLLHTGALRTALVVAATAAATLLLTYSSGLDGLELTHGQLSAGVGRRAGGLRSGDATPAAAAPVSFAQTAHSGSAALGPASGGEAGPLDGAGSVKSTTGSGPLGPTLHPAGTILRTVGLPTPALAFIDLLTMQFYTRGARRYLEWGSGGSTSLVAPLAQRAWSVDNNKEWCAKTADREDVKFVRGWAVVCSVVGPLSCFKLLLRSRLRHVAQKT